MSNGGFLGKNIDLKQSGIFLQYKTSSDQGIVFYVWMVKNILGRNIIYFFFPFWGVEVILSTHTPVWLVFEPLYTMIKMHLVMFLFCM